MDFAFVGHGGSDGLHGYVPSLDQVVADTVSSVENLIIFCSIHFDKFFIGTQQNKT